MRKKFKLMGASNIQIYSLNNGTDLFIKYIELEQIVCIFFGISQFIFPAAEH